MAENDNFGLYTLTDLEYCFVQCSAIARSIFPMFFQISPFCFDFCHFVMIFSKRKSGSFCSVALHKQPESAVLLQKSKQSWQKAKQIGDI